MLTVIEKVIFLQNVDLFSDIVSEELGYIAAIAEEHTFYQSDIIYREQQPGNALYIVIDGKVRLHRDEQEIMLAGSGEAFGAWALVDEEPRVATATVLEESRLLKISREDFFDLLADHVQISEGIFKTLVKRLRGLADRVTSLNEKSF